MSDRVLMLACFEYFLDCPRPYLTRAGEAKPAEGDYATGFIEGIFAESAPISDVFVGAVSIEEISTWGICVSARLFGTDCWLLIKWGFIDVLLNLVKLCSNLIITDLL